MKMKLVQLTTYNIRNGGTSVTMVNADNINTVVGGEVLQTESGNIDLVRLNFPNESIYILQDDLRWVAEVNDPKPAPKAKAKPKAKVKASPKPKAKPKATK